MTHNFVRGQFKSYEIVCETGLHIGAIGEDLGFGEVVLYDGYTMKRGDDGPGSAVPNLRGAIKAGWIVPEGEEGGYVSRPADIKIHATETHGNDRGEGYSVSTAQDEERDMGSRENVRRNANKNYKPSQDQAVKSRQGAEASEGAPTGSIPVDEEEVLHDGTPGQVVGRFSSKANADPVSIDDAGKTIKSLESKNAPSVQKRRATTGDVEESRVGEDLEDLLPEAASSGKAEAGVSGEKKENHKEIARKSAEEARRERLSQLGIKEDSSKANFSVGSTTVGTADDGEEVGKIRSVEEAGTEGDAVSSGEEATASEESDTIPEEEIIQAKIEIIQQFVPGFEWDFNLHWKQRVQKASEYKDNMPVLNAILSIETEAVKRHTLKKIYG